MRRTSSPDRTSLIRIAVAGFTVTELMVVLGLIGLLVATGVPYFITYWQSSRLRAGAEELASVVNEARQLAIRRNTAVCVQRQAANTIRFLRDSNAACSAGTVHTGPGTNTSGDITLSDSVQVSAASGSVVFNYLGGATPAATYTVRNPTNGRTLEVRVATTGRVLVCNPAPAACP